ncbi:TIGR04222 domain-containing membrane protein [Nocardia sp. NBC_01327]|uniref:TIGR04222 domain-containing membrane protein n=1 Tax=Nocardia sp. NBC_01327 TaxID=2903593 RepID=UPI002E15E234|nr:TIGR04222 domain-containing membrane protein [Nocardia sp. NBC_01327]
MDPWTALAGAPHPAAADTWGISGPTFLSLYALAGILAALYGFGRRAMVLRDARGAQTSAHALSPTETAMLFDDRRPVLTGLAQLRGYQLINSAGATTRHLTATEEQALDPVSQSLHAHLIGSANRNVLTLDAVARDPLTALRNSLTDRGYLIGPEQRNSLLLAAFPLGALFLFGVLRVIAGLANRHGVGYLILVMVVVLICTLLILRPPRLTRLGRRAADESVRRNGHLRPHNTPAYSAYGPDSAALATALFGATVLVSLDPALAHATGALWAGGGFTGSGGGYSGSNCSSSDSGSSGSNCSSSSSGCSSSSCGSSCGGGGCGSGCGG